MRYFIPVIFLAILLSGCSLFTGKKASVPKFTEGRSSIETDNSANKTLNFYYYIPAAKKTVSQKMPVMVLVNGLNGSGEAMVTPELKDLAEREGFVIVAPTFKFDEENWESCTSYQYPGAWSGYALIDIIDTLKYKDITPGKLYMMGVSAGAQFCGRFALIHPELVSATVIHAFGGEIRPDKYIDVKFWVTVGDKDEELRKQFLEGFMKEAKYYKIDAETKRYDIGHSLCPELYVDAIAFFEKVKKENGD